MEQDLPNQQFPFSLLVHFPCIAMNPNWIQLKSYYLDSQHHEIKGLVIVRETIRKRNDILC